MVKKKKFWVDVNWSKTSDSLVLRDIPGDITSIGDQRAQNLMQNISINAAINNLSIKLEHQGFQVLNPILTNGYKKLPSIEFKYLKNFENFTLYEKLNISYFKADSIHGFITIRIKIINFFIELKILIEGSRIFSNFKILNQTYFNGLNINSSLGVKSIHYNLDDGAQSNSMHVPNFKLDISTLFYRKDKNESSCSKA